MAEDAPATPPTQKIRCMPESYARRRGAGRPRRGGRVGRGRGEGGDAAPTQQTQGGASTSQAVEEAGTSSQAYLPSTPSDPGDHDPIDYELPDAAGHFISGVLHVGDGGYRSDTQFDGSQVHLDLNEPLSGPSHLFMALGGTPPSAAHVPGGSWDIPFMEFARLATPPASPALAEQPDEPAAPGQARRAPRRRGCGTGGHM
ncbi:hypothetical protein PIB30_047515 [Stylosanthes scabra]|uniref:Uncharacterized protein n=1 Tax=Stylosanthes scabra TaxID=79078 RepID=A0ABU6XEL0_9FABA|nr:hypothetical protein [Stylosanthes scabra]